MEMNGIKIIWSETGHWVARCNHENGIIELNKTEFPRLSPMMQDYVLCHEYVHLVYNEYDEERCNAITDKIFIGRAEGRYDLIQRRRFIKQSYNSANVTGITFSAIAAIISGVVKIGSTVASAIIAKSKKNGYYSMTTSDRKELVDSLMKSAFAESANTNEKSAKDIFWEYMSQCQTGDSSYNKWIKKNSFAKNIIKSNEAAYGFGFSETKTVNILNYPGVKFALIAALLVVIVLIIKKYRK